MANWEKIYREYNKNSNEWKSFNNGIIPACLKKNIIPPFKKFIKNSKFKQKYVLDIGCGTGNYLFYLSSLDFKTDGVDSSPTSIKMVKKIILDKSSNIKLANMYKMRIVKNKYDLVTSISTMNHGFKEETKKLVNKIYSSLIANGKIFITLPDIECSKKWKTFKKHKILKPGVIIPLIGPEKGIPHSFYSKKEIKIMFEKFCNLKLNLDKTGKWIITGLSPKSI